MASTFAQILHSKQFTFLIGDDMVPIVVHAGAIAALSAPLDRLINGSMRGAQQNIAEFPELHPEDFERVCEFAYTGTFAEPKPVLFDEQEVDIHEDFYVKGRRLAWMNHVDLRKKALLNMFLEDTFPEFIDIVDFVPAMLDYQRVKLISKEEDADTDRQNHWKEDVSNVLLSYARLYVFAQQYMIDVLKRMAKRGLREYLIELDIFPLTRGAVTDLVRYVYDNNHTPDKAEGGEIDPLRQTVVQFVALHLDVFNDFPEHRQLLREGGDYAVDLQDTTWKLLI